MINAKRAKHVRKAVRVFLSHLPKVSLKPMPTPQMLVPDFSRGLNFDGTQHMKLVAGATPRVLDKKCQRAGYKAAKKHIAAQRLAPS